MRASTSHYCIEKNHYNKISKNILVELADLKKKKQNVFVRRQDLY